MHSVNVVRACVFLGLFLTALMMIPPILTWAIFRTSWHGFLSLLSHDLPSAFAIGTLSGSWLAFRGRMDSDGLPEKKQLTIIASASALVVYAVKYLPGSFAPNSDTTPDLQVGMAVSMALFVGPVFAQVLRGVAARGAFPQLEAIPDSEGLLKAQQEEK